MTEMTIILETCVPIGLPLLPLKKMHPPPPTHTKTKTKQQQPLISYGEDSQSGGVCVCEEGGGGSTFPQRSITCRDELKTGEEEAAAEKQRVQTAAACRRFHPAGLFWG